VKFEMLFSLRLDSYKPSFYCLIASISAVSRIRELNLLKNTVNTRKWHKIWLYPAYLLPEQLLNS
jgi:hypothetical protein